MRVDNKATLAAAIAATATGWGPAQRDLIRLVTVGNKAGQDLVMNGLEHTGLVHTDPNDPKQAVTDSAAAATAFSTGVKTFNGAIGVDVNGKPVRTVLEDARRAGKSTGLVTTSQVTDATPAAYAAHVSDRGNLVDRAKALGYRYVSTRDGLRSARGPKLLGLFANEEMFEHREEGHGDLYAPAVPLPELAAKALDVLSQDRDGFFVLIEEEAIDEMGHENNAGLMIKSGAALDQTVKVAVDFARRHPGTGVDTPITASGPGSEAFDGVIDNTDVHDAVARAMRGR
jgi:alkaline phosphatase